MSGKNVPAIRYEGFTDAWEQRKLLVFADKAVDNRGKTPPLDPDGTHPLIEVAALGYGKPNYTKVEKYLNDYAYANCLRDYIKEGDILFSTVGSIGLVSLMDDCENAVIAQNIVAFRAKEGFCSEFLYALFSTGENQDRANRIVMGAVQPSIKVSQLVDVEYFVTENIEEQRKLGKLFLDIDNLITLHQRKLDAVKKLKTAMLQKMFPQEGGNVPEIRFDGFTDAWEQRKLGDVCKMNGRIGFRGYTEKDIITKESGGVLTFSPTNIVDNQLTVGVKNTYITREKYDESPEIIVHNGDILFVKTGSTLGKSALVTGIEEDCTVNPQVVVIKVESDSQKVLSVALTSTPVQKQITAVKIGGTVPTMTETELKNINLVLPSNIDERIRIGEYFSNLDNLITLHQRKLDKLQNLKNAMLDKMFVA